MKSASTRVHSAAVLVQVKGAVTALGEAAEEDNLVQSFLDALAARSTKRRNAASEIEVIERGGAVLEAEVRVTHRAVD